MLLVDYRASDGAVPCSHKCAEGRVYRLDILVQGFPGKTPRHGGLGWSTISLLRGHGENIIVDTGFFNTRFVIADRLAELGLARDDVTSVLITHCHWDHLVNYPIFPNAKYFAPRRDVEWALAQPVPTWHIPEYYVERLASDPRTVLIGEGDDILPGLSVIDVPGHTPGHVAFVATGERGRLVFTGDAAKNQAEIACVNADMSLDMESSKASIRRLVALAAEDPNNLVICGHDRLLSIVNGRIVHRAELLASIRARLTSEFEHEADINLVLPGPN